jgi:hypothetical protein
MDIDFRALFQSVRARPEMYGIDNRYRMLLAFVNGCDAATGGELLTGLHEWVHRRSGGKGRTPIAWDWQLVDARHPDFRRRSRSFADLSGDEDAELVGDLFDTLDAFLTERGSDFRFNRR